MLILMLFSCLEWLFREAEDAQPLQLSHGLAFHFLLARQGRRYLHDVEIREINQDRGDVVTTSV